MVSVTAEHNTPSPNNVLFTHDLTYFSTVWCPGGRPDSRTLHTAQDAVDEKWMTQLWVSGGLRQKAPSISASNLPAIPFDPSGKKVKRKKKNK